MKMFVGIAAALAVGGCAGSTFPDDYDNHITHPGDPHELVGSWLSRAPIFYCIFEPAPGGDVYARFLTRWSNHEHRMRLVREAPDKLTGVCEDAAAVVIFKPGSKPELTMLYHFGDEGGDTELFRPRSLFVRPNHLEDSLLLLTIICLFPYVVLNAPQ